MKNLFLLLLSLFFSAPTLHAQTKTEGSPSENRLEVKSYKESSIHHLISVELKIDKLNAFADITVSESNSLYEASETLEDKIKIKAGLISLENLKSAQSFQDVIALASGKMTLVSHQVVSTEKQIIHYFIFSL